MTALPDYYCPACDRRWLLTEPCGHIAITPPALDRLRCLVSELTAQGCSVGTALLLVPAHQPPPDVAIAGTWGADGFRYTFMHPALLPTFRARLLRVLAARFRARLRVLREPPATEPHPKTRNPERAR